MFLNIIDYFIKDKHELSEEELAINQLVVVVILLLLVVSAIFSFLSIFGLANTENNILAVLVCAFFLLLSSKVGYTRIPFSILIVIFTVVIIHNINITGDIFSYNHKWFFPIILFVVFTKRAWIPYYFGFVVIIQIYYYFISAESRMSPTNPDISKAQEFGDNISFFLITFALLFLFSRFINNRTEKIKNSQELLKKRSEALLQSNQELERFAYIASHDIKTPLRNIISFTSLLEKELENNKTERTEEYLSFVKSGSIKLNNLVEDLLSYSKLSNESLIEEEMIDMNQIVEEIEYQLSDYLKSKNAKIEITKTLPKIKSRRIWILGLFQNLIENGLKYNTSDNPRVTISQFFVNDKWIIEFKDNGIGIDRKYHESIFEMFSRLHADAAFEGTGLGLAFCKKTVEKIGGEIELESKLGVGSSFRLRFNKDVIFDK